jgi:hypothetical protein
MTMAAALLLVALGLAPQAPPPDAPKRRPADSADTSPFSVDRIRKALERPSSDRLIPRPITADFVVDIRERQRFERLMPPLWDFKSGPVPPGGLYAYEQLQQTGTRMAQPLFLVDLLAIGHSIGHAIGDARAAAAHDAVERAIAEYCGARPDRGVGIQLCASGPVR